VKKPIEGPKADFVGDSGDQRVDLFLSVKDNLRHLRALPGTRQSDGGAPCRCLSGIFSPLPGSRPQGEDLSGGVRRRVQVAKVFMVDTPVLFLMNLDRDGSHS